MKNKDFFYQQYNQINWKNQEKTRINSYINNYIIDHIILENRKGSTSVFDIGFGIGFFFEILSNKLKEESKDFSLAGCEPSHVNFEYFQTNKSQKISKTIPVNVQEKNFLDAEIGANSYEFVTAIYVFTHFLFEELEDVVKKISLILKNRGKFILIVANERYLEEKLDTQRDLFIEKTEEKFRGNLYQQVLHYSRIPEIGTVVDYNREEQFYVDLFESYDFKMIKKEKIDDSGFISTLLVFEKQ